MFLPACKCSSHPCLGEYVVLENGVFSLLQEACPDVQCEGDETETEGL